MVGGEGFLVDQHRTILDRPRARRLRWIKPRSPAQAHAAGVTGYPGITLVLDGPLAVATLARAPVNAIDEAWLERLDQALDAVERAAGVSCLLIRSAERAFCAGADLALMRSRFATPEGRAQMVHFVRGLQRVYARLARLPQATVAEIGGAAMGGGLELALACDLRIAAEDARLGLPEARLGLLPGAGGTQRLARIAGEAVAKRLILRGEVVTGADAERLGLVHWAVPAAELAARSRALAAEITALPAAAIAACKRCIDAPLEGGDGYEAEVAGTAALLADAETQRRVRDFLEKRR
jgi:enoyl-CoA hydratase/carnithine racemase